MWFLRNLRIKESAPLKQPQRAGQVAEMAKGFVLRNERVYGRWATSTLSRSSKHPTNKASPHSLRARLRGNAARKRCVLSRRMKIGRFSQAVVSGHRTHEQFFSSGGHDESSTTRGRARFRANGRAGGEYVWVITLVDFGATKRQTLARFRHTYVTRAAAKTPARPI